MSTSRRKPPTPKEMQRTVDTFNANLPVGSVVEYRSDPGASPLTTVVRGEAFLADAFDGTMHEGDEPIEYLRALVDQFVEMDAGEET